jgi:hypothetical protein
MCDTCLAMAGPGNSICLKCTALLASQQAATGVIKEQAEAVQRQEELQQGKKNKKKSILALQVLVIIAAVVVLAMQLPEISASLEPEQPVRIGTYATDETTDQCIELLWKASRDLQNGVLPGPDMVCPGSQSPLIASEENNDLIVRVPNPERYGFKELRVSKKAPVPELVQ